MLFYQGRNESEEKMMTKNKTPLWFIVSMIAYSIPVGILLMIFPTFGSMVWEKLNIAIEPSWIIVEGLKWAMFLDITLVIWAYLSWKFDYLAPWLHKKFDRVVKVEDEALFFEI
jgi:hypothetical protein